MAVKVGHGHAKYNQCMGTFLQTKKGQELLRSVMEQLITEFTVEWKHNRVNIVRIEYTKEGIVIYDED